MHGDDRGRESRSSAGARYNQGARVRGRGVGQRGQGRGCRREELPPRMGLGPLPVPPPLTGAVWRGQAPASEASCPLIQLLAVDLGKVSGPLSFHCLVFGRRPPPMRQSDHRYGRCLEKAERAVLVFAQ